MLEPRFCYRISAEAGWAHDGEGNDCSCYTQVDFTGGNRIEEEKYNEMHEKLKEGVANQFGIDPSHLELISQKEHDNNQEED